MASQGNGIKPSLLSPHQVVADLGHLARPRVTQMHHTFAHQAQQRLGGTNSKVTPTTLQCRWCVRQQQQQQQSEQQQQQEQEQ